MPSIYDLKPAFQNLLRPLVRRMAAAGITANQVTIAAALLSLLVGLLIWRDPYSATWLLLVPVVLFVRMALNAVDGMLAREHAMQSKSGAILNEVGDVVSDAALYLPLALIPGVDPLLVCTAVVLALIGEMTGVLGQTIGASRRYDGPMGKSDRALWLGLLCLLLGLGLQAGVWTGWFLAAVNLLAAWTIVNRARGALREAGV